MQTGEYGAYWRREADFRSGMGATYYLETSISTGHITCPKNRSISITMIIYNKTRKGGLEA